MKPLGAQFTNYFSLFSSSIAQLLSTLTVGSSPAPLPSCSPPVFARSCPFFFLFFSLCTDWVLSLLPSAFFPAPSFFLHQIFKRFLVSTSLTRMPRYRPMAPTVGFSPPLCISRTFLTPTSADIIPLCSVCPVCHCRVPFFFNTLFLLVDFLLKVLHGFFAFFYIKLLL